MIKFPLSFYEVKTNKDFYLTNLKITNSKKISQPSKDLITSVEMSFILKRFPRI